MTPTPDTKLSNGRKPKLGPQEKVYKGEWGFFDFVDARTISDKYRRKSLKVHVLRRNVLSQNL